MDCSISRESLVAEIQDYAGTLERAIRNPQDGDCPKIGEYFRREFAAATAFLAHLEAETVNVSAAPENVAPAASTPRCAHFKSIKRAYAIATKAGLNVKADEAMRAAFGAFLGKPVASRETLNGSDWRAVGDAMKVGYLTW